MASDRLRAANADQGEDAEMDMSPMIDMVFLLLLFFLVVSNPRTIKIDNEVKPPVASNAKTPEIIHGKIVVNIRTDGTFYQENVNIRLEDEDAVEQYVEERKEVVIGNGYSPVLHVRGDKAAVFKHCRTVIRAAARAGVNQVAFGAYSVAN